MVAARPGIPAQCTAAAGHEKPLSFWSSDLHHGFRMEVPSIFLALGQCVIMAGRSAPGPWNHALQFAPPWIYSHPRLSTLPVNLRSKLIERDISWPTVELKEPPVQEMFELLKHTDVMRSVDAFICMYPFAMCEAYMPFNRSIIWWAGHRFTNGRCTTRSWSRITNRVRASAVVPEDASRPRHVVAAGSVYDAEYIYYFTGVRPLVLEATSMHYVPKLPPWNERTFRSEFLIFGRCNSVNLSSCAPYLVRSEEEAASGFVFRGIQHVEPGRHALESFAKYRAVIVFPCAPRRVRCACPLCLRD